MHVSYQSLVALLLNSAHFCSPLHRYDEYVLEKPSTLMRAVDALKREQVLEKAGTVDERFQSLEAILVS